jgi:hypothetical protein
MLGSFGYHKNGAELYLVNWLDIRVVPFTVSYT